MPLKAASLGRPGHLRWWIVVFVMLGAVVNYLARSTMGVAASTIMADLHLTTAHYSLITGAFQLGLMLQPLCGLALDTLGLRRGFGLFALAWSLITFLHGFASSWQMFAGLRLLLGLAEGSANPAGMKTVAEWFPARERGLAAGVFNLGASAGSILAPPLVAWAILNHDWRAAFYIVGVIGLAWAGLWLWLYRGPERHPRLGAAERTLIEAGRETPGAAVRPSIWRILRQRNFWGIAIPRFLADPTWGTLSFWAPLYFTSVRHFDLGQIAMFVWLPFVAADLGCLFGPTVALFLQRRGFGLINARRAVFTLGAAMMIGVAFVGLADDAGLAVLLLCLAGFAHQTLSVTVITMSSDLFPRSEVATATGLAGMMGNLGVLVFSLLIGGLVTTVGYTPFFIALAGFDILGAIVLWTLVREPPASAGRDFAVVGAAP